MKDFIEYIESNARNFPSRIAVVDGEAKTTYGDFFSLYSNISQNLQNIKTTPKVVLDLPQSVKAYALIFAVLNIGGTFCPLNLETPIERKKHIVSEFKPDVIIVDSDIKRSQFGEVYTVQISQLVSPKETLIYEDSTCDSEAIAYVIYTSGSTGMPKGVMIYRKALNKFLEWSIPTYGAGENDIWGQFSLLSFDLSIVDIFTCLCSGATLLVMADTSSKLMPSRAIEKNKISIWHSIPSAVDFMIKGEEMREADFSSLKLLSFCGEPLRQYHLDFLFGKNESVIVFNTYGPTEGTLFCMWQELKNSDYINFAETSMSLGKAIPGWNLKLKSVEDSREEKEVVIYGEYVGKGYIGIHGDESGFEEILVGEKSYMSFETGDLILEKNGNIFFSRRKDRQIKIRGHRIELDEIDFWNRKFFKKACVTVLHNDSLHSFIETGVPIEEKAIREFLAEKIESYKIPRTFIAVKDIPRNANLKVNINALIELIP